MNSSLNIISAPSDKETGSALIYILIAIALLVALTSSFMKPSNQQQTAQNSFNAVSALKSQIEFVRSSIQECVIKYPGGDRGADGASGLIGTSNTPYPISPSDSYYTSPESDNLLRRIKCPGNPGDSEDHAPIFSGVSGKFLPPPPDLFDDWEYYSGEDGVFFFNRTDKTDAFIQTALQKLDDQFSECEADIIDASAADIDLTSTAGVDDPVCVSGETCFRVWMTIQNTAIYNGDTDGEENAASCP